MSSVRSRLVLGFAAAAVSAALGCGKAELKLGEADPTEARKAAPDASAGMLPEGDERRGGDASAAGDTDARTTPVPPGCPVCGNGIVECGEQCDDGNTVTERAVAYGLLDDLAWWTPRYMDPSGPAVCNDNCLLDVGKRRSCGDRILDAGDGEECDGGEGGAWFQSDYTRVCSCDCKLTQCAGKDLSRFTDDMDCDGVSDGSDNCRFGFNPDQSDADNNGVGDACAPSVSNKPPPPGGSRCPSIFITVCELGCTRPAQHDFDNDGVLNGMDLEVEDNCPAVANPDQRDSNHNGRGDACDSSAICPAHCPVPKSAP